MDSFRLWEQVIYEIPAAVIHMLWHISKEKLKIFPDVDGVDAICDLQNISYPQDVNLLNEVRENLEVMIDGLCYEYNYYRPRLYHKNAIKDYLSLAKCRGHIYL